jgi:hypothetical protein
MQKIITLCYTITSSAFSARSKDFAGRISQPGQRRGTSNGSTFAPPTIWGCDGSNPFRNSRLRMTDRAVVKASFKVALCRNAALKKALPK